MDRITVVSDNDAIHAQARTYAEYRVFAALARHPRRMEQVRRVRVTLRQVTATPCGDAVACAVTAFIEPAAALRVRVAAPHVYTAINRAIDRLDRVLQRHVVGRHSEGVSAHRPVNSSRKKEGAA